MGFPSQLFEIGYNIGDTVGDTEKDKINGVTPNIKDSQNFNNVPRCLFCKLSYVTKAFVPYCSNSCAQADALRNKPQVKSPPKQEQPSQQERNQALREYARNE